MRVPTNAQVCMFIKLVLFLISLNDAKQSLITFKNEENSKNIFEYFWITVNFARDIKTSKQNDRDLNKDKKIPPIHSFDCIIEKCNLREDTGQCIVIMDGGHHAYLIAVLSLWYIHFSLDLQI